MAKLNDFEALSGLLSADEKRTLLAQAASREAKKAIGAGLEARVIVDRKARRGREVTVIQRIALPTSKLEALAQDLRKLCGAGGTVKEGAIELQGDHVKKVQSELARLQFRVSLK